MKKSIISIAAVLVLCILLMPAAFADSSVGLGSASAGSELSIPVFAHTSQVFYDSAALPDGCGIDAVNGMVCLVGTPMRAGSYIFVLRSDTESYDCYIDIVPDTPNCTVSGSKICRKGETVEMAASASVKDYGSLSFQWYRNSECSVVGGNPIPGATGAVWYADTSAVGTSYYYCNVTNNNNGLTMNAYTDIVTVTVNEPEINAVAILQKPDKMSYKVGETVDTTGLVLQLQYSDGTTGTVTNDYTVTPRTINSDTKGIWITYKNKEVYLQLDVEEKLSCMIYSLPTKTEYTVGELLETSGLAIKLMSGDTMKDIITSGFTCQPLSFNTPGPQIITVTYKEASCSFTVNVKAKAADELTVYTLPTKTEYTVGDKLDTSGLVLSFKSGDKVNLVSSGFKAEPETLSTAGTTLVTVSYNNTLCTFTVTVKEKELPVVTTPAVTAAPGSDNSQTSRPSSSSSGTSQHGSNLHRMLIGFIAVLAVLALIILVLYIYVARTENFDESALGKLLKKLKRYRDE